MTTGPTFYYPTTNKPYRRYVPRAPYVYDSLGNTLYDSSLQNRLNFILSASNTYTAPLFSGGFAGNYLSVASRNSLGGISLSDPSYTDLQILKQLPKEKRGLQPFIYNNVTLFNFADDAGYLPGTNINMIDSNGNYVAKSNVYWGFWPDNGISFTQQWSKEIYESMAKEGATLGYVMIDYEEAINLFTNPISSITGATLYTMPWRGLSSWLEYYLLEGGQTNYDFSNTTQGNINRSAFEAAWSRFKAKSYEAAFLTELQNYNTDGVVSNYMDWAFPFNGGYTALNVLSEYSPGEPGWRHRSFSGNAGAPVLYGWFSVGSMIENYDYANNTSAVSYLDPTIIYTYLNSYQTSLLDKYFTYGPWSSFLGCVSEMRATRQNNPGQPITPWIPSVWQSGQYNWKYGPIYKIIDNAWAQGPNQIRVEIVHNRWRFKNINTETGGFSGPTGITNGIRIVTNSTSTQKLLSYVYNGLTSGTTYVFSYYVNLGCGYTGFAAGFNHFRRTHYQLPTGITYYQTLPAATGPFYGTGSIYYPPGSSGWTEVEFEFNIPQDDPFNPTFNPTLEVSVIEDSVTSGGNTMFITDPSFEIKSSPSNIPVISMNSILSEENKIQGTQSPACGFADAVVGYNPRLAVYVTDRPGNSAYYYEMIRHCCLMGAKAFGWFNNFSLVDNSIPGARTIGYAGQDAVGAAKQSLTLRSGFTGFINDYNKLNETLHDVHLKIKGYTSTSAGMNEKWDWSRPYFASAAPDTKGQTWWWRITVQNGYTLYVNGMTLPDSNGNVGMWLGTTGPTLAGVSITSTSPIPPSEPAGITAVRSYDFVSMNSISDLTGNSFTFTRGSTASYIGPSGYLLFAGVNQPRFHYDPITLKKRGLLIESSVANQLNWSESFANTGGANNNWIDVNLTRISGNTSPSNDLSSIRFTATGGNATLISSAAVGNTLPKIFSFWCKGVTGTENLSYTVDGGTLWNQVPNINTNWNRVYFGPVFNGNCFIQHQVGFKFGNTNDSILLWGAQLENIKTVDANRWARSSGAWSFNTETSYIKTDSTTVTRSADNLGFVGVTSWIGQTYGTVIVESENMQYNTSGLFAINGLSGGSFAAYWFAPDGSSVRFDTYTAKNNQQVVSALSPVFTTRHHARDTSYKWFVSWSPLGYKIGSNGMIKSISGSNRVVDISSFNFGREFTIQSLKYYDRTFEDNTIRQLVQAGVTQIGWLNNGDGMVHPVTYYRGDQTS